MVAAPGDGAAAARAHWLLTHEEGLNDPGMTIRKYDSVAVRAREPFAAALRDLDFALACTDALLTQPTASIRGVRVLQRALWDACLNALFKHYGPGANRDVKAIFTEAISKRDPADRDAWEALFEERNRRVAHPVGVREGHTMAVSVDASGEPHATMDVGLSALRPVDPAVRWAQQLIGAIREPIASREEELTRLVADEINALPNEQILALPPLDHDQLEILRFPGTEHGLAPADSPGTD